MKTRKKISEAVQLDDLNKGDAIAVCWVTSEGVEVRRGVFQSFECVWAEWFLILKLKDGTEDQLTTRAGLQVTRE